MKKMLCIGILSTMLVLLTGCGEKKVTCESTGKEDGMTTQTKVVGLFKKDKISKITTTRTLNIDDDYASFMDSLYDYYKEQLESNDTDGVKSSIDKKDQTIIVTIEMDPSKMKDDNGNNVDTNMSIDDFKKNYEDQGLSCK